MMSGAAISNGQLEAYAESPNLPRFESHAQRREVHEGTSNNLHTTNSHWYDFRPELD